MKILLVNKFHYIKGGSETYYFALAEALKEKGHEVIFFSMKHEKNVPCRQEKYFVSNSDYNQEGISPLKKAKLGLSLLYSKEAERKMERLIQTERPDVVLFNLVHRQITLSIIKPIRKYNIPIGFMLHDYICACPNYIMLCKKEICNKCMGGHFSNCIRQKCVKDSYAKSILGALEAYLIRFLNLYNKIDFFIVPSAFMKEKMDQAKFTKAPILHMTNPLPLHYEIGHSYVKTNNLLYFGRITHEKGILTLLAAMRKLDSSVHLNIAGEGSQREELERYVRKYKLNDRVHFLGYQSGTALEEIIAQSRAIIVPSEWYEGCPYTIMEALAKGKPIIVSKLGGLLELLEDKVNGYSFQPGNSDDLLEKINLLMNLTDEEYQQMCDAAMDIVRKKCSIDDYTNKLLRQYEIILKRKRMSERHG